MRQLWKVRGLTLRFGADRLANDEKPRLPIPPPRLRTPRPENIGDPKDRRSILSTAFSISKSSSQDRLFNLEGLSLRSKVDQDTPFRTLEEEYSKSVFANAVCRY